jgi:hypothetical protein
MPAWLKNAVTALSAEFDPERRRSSRDPRRRPGGAGRPLPSAPIPVVCGIENDLGGRDKMLAVAEPQDDPRRISRVMDKLLGRRVDAVITTASGRGDERDPPTTKVSLPDRGRGRMAADTAMAGNGTPTPAGHAATIVTSNVEPPTR